jgi:hypothetical protein
MCPSPSITSTTCRPRRRVGMTRTTWRSPAGRATSARAVVRESHEHRREARPGRTTHSALAGGHRRARVELEFGATPGQAARAVGIGPRTLRRWRARVPTLGDLGLGVIERLLQLAAVGCVDAIALGFHEVAPRLLTRKRGSRAVALPSAMHREPSETSPSNTWMSWSQVSWTRVRPLPRP